MVHTFNAFGTFVLSAPASCMNTAHNLHLGGICSIISMVDVSCLLRILAAIVTPVVDAVLIGANVRTVLLLPEIRELSCWFLLLILSALGRIWASVL